MKHIVFLPGKIRLWVFITILICAFTNISAQKPADFSGTWIMDIAKSDANYSEYYSGMTCAIKQTPQEITIERTSLDKNGKQTKQDPLTCGLDGKEIMKEQYGGIDKYSAKWSPDQKVLTIRCVRTMNGSDYGSNESYSLSGDSRILTVNTTDLKGETSIIEVYNKK